MLPAKPYTWYIDTSTHRRATRCQHANASLVQHDPVYIELGIRSTSLWNTRCHLIM